MKFIICFLLFIISAHAQKIIVAQDGSGNFNTIQAAINSPFTLSGHTIQVGAGNYNEDVVVNKSLTLLGAGCGLTTISGPIGGGGATIQVAAAGVIIDGFTITRDGNNPVDWNNAGLNSAGIAIQGLTVNAEIRNCCITGNRSGIDVNNSNGKILPMNCLTSQMMLMTGKSVLQV